jgi:hypothetical protein
MTRVLIGGVMAGSVLLGAAAPAFATAGFTGGDLVVYEVGTSGGATPSSTSGPVSLVEYPTTGGASVFSVGLPQTTGGGNFQISESGSATFDGEVTLSADGSTLVATGYTAPVGTASITSATNTPRTVALVNAAGTVDTSTSLSDTTTEGQNFRSATMAGVGQSIYTGGGAGIGLTTDGGTSATYLNTDNVHDAQIVGGQLYESTTKVINQVGTGLPTSATPADTTLTTSATKEPAQFALVSLTGGSTPDTLYVADEGNNAIEKYSLESGVWTLTGSVTADLVTGLTASVSGGVASIYATDAVSTTASFNTQLIGLTDSSGKGGSLTGATVTTLVTAPQGVSFKGVAFAPVAPPAVTPEVPSILLLPLAGVVVFGGATAVVYRRRRHLA